MIVFESRKQRRLVLRLERGEDPGRSLERLAVKEKVSSAWVRGIGELEWAELSRHDQTVRASEPPQRFDSPAQILSLEGNVSLVDAEPKATLFVTLARRTDNGVDLLGGRLISGGALYCELVLTCFEDVRLERIEDDETGLWLWSGASRPGVEADRAPAPTRAWTAPAEETEAEIERGGAVSWADVAAASAAPDVTEPSGSRKKRRRKKDAEKPATPAFEPPPIPEKQRSSDVRDELVPEKGDWVQHRQFGLCRVDRESSEGGLVIRLPSGIRKTIRLDFMDVGQPRMEGKRRVFPLRPRRR